MSSLGIAGVAALVIGLVHSVLGEWLAFRNFDAVRGLRVMFGSDLFSKRTFRVTWHVATILAWALGAQLVHFDGQAALTASDVFVVRSVALAFGLSGVLATIGTRGRHPGGPGLAAVGVLAWLGVG